MEYRTLVRSDCGCFSPSRGQIQKHVVQLDFPNKVRFSNRLHFFLSSLSTEVYQSLPPDHLMSLKEHWQWMMFHPVWRKCFASFCHHLPSLTGSLACPPPLLLLWSQFGEVQLHCLPRSCHQASHWPLDTTAKNPLDKDGQWGHSSERALASFQCVWTEEWPVCWFQAASKHLRRRFNHKCLKRRSPIIVTIIYVNCQWC